MKTITWPTIERIDIPQDEIESAVANLLDNAILPDGSEVTDWHAIYKYHGHIKRGFFYRFVFFGGVKEAKEFNDAVKDVKLWMELGLV